MNTKTVVVPYWFEKWYKSFDSYANSNERRLYYIARCGFGHMFTYADDEKVEECGYISENFKMKLIEAVINGYELGFTKISAVQAYKKYICGESVFYEYYNDFFDAKNPLEISKEAEHVFMPSEIEQKEIVFYTFDKM